MALPPAQLDFCVLPNNPIITITATDEFGTGTASFKLTVLSGHLPPVLDQIADQTTSANIALKVPLTVSDPDTPIGQLQFSGASAKKQIAPVKKNDLPFLLSFGSLT